MVRSNWKGKFTVCDFKELFVIFNRIPLSRFNIYLFSVFKNLDFEIYNRTEISNFLVENIYLGFTIGCFVFTREINVIHNQKKSKKQKLQARIRFSKFKKGDTQSLLKNLKVKEKNKKNRVLNVLMRL